MQRALDKTENMKARAAAVGELEAAGTFDDLTQLGSGKDDIDRQLEAIGAGGAVDDELAKMKAELGAGTPAPAALGTGGAAAAPEEDAAPGPAAEGEGKEAGT
jgi:phage shock protein A